MKGQSNILLVFFAIVGCLAKPPPTFLEYKDSLGQYSFGYSAPGSARSEVRSIDGSTRGSYSYVDALGNIQSAQYTADSENGFRITATNLPQAPSPVEDTPEVTAARIDHFKALEAASKLAEENPAETKDAKKSEATSSDSSTDLHSSKSIEASSQDIPTETKSVKSSEGTAILNSTEALNGKSNEATAESVGVEKENENDASESSQALKKSVQVPSRSEVPAVTTSFVIPGALNLHTRIPLHRYDGPVGQIASESPSTIIAQPSMPPTQDANLSMLTPAGTKMGETMKIEKPENPEANSLEISNQPQQYSNAIVSGIVAPSNVYAFTYGIGIDPNYHQYNPYRYFPYGIL